MSIVINDNRFDNTEEVYLEFKEYADGSVAIQGFTELEGLFTTYTVNLSGYGLYAPEGHVFIKEYSEGEGSTEILSNAGVITPISPVYVGPYGATCTLAKLNENVDK